MKKALFILSLLAVVLQTYAQDSCYVYTKLHWAPRATKYVAQIQLNEGGSDDDQDILDEEGNTLKFDNIYHAMNYLSTKGWEFLKISSLNPENMPGFKLEQYILIRKKFPLETAMKYSAPIIKKKK